MTIDKVKIVEQRINIIETNLKRVCQQ